MPDKAEWRSRDFTRSQYPERINDYIRYDELVMPDGNVIATIEQFKSNDRCFYANTDEHRSGCVVSYEIARQWCEAKTGNKVN